MTVIVHYMDTDFCSFTVKYLCVIILINVHAKLTLTHTEQHQHSDHNAHVSLEQACGGRVNGFTKQRLSFVFSEMLRNEKEVVFSFTSLFYTQVRPVYLIYLSQM